MPSIRARVYGRIVRLIVKRKDWGGPEKLTRRARRIFGSPRILQWWAARDMTITPVNETGVRGEWVIPKKAGGEPAVILYIHGGGYVSCSPSTHRPISSALARLTGLRVFSVDYRLAPENPFPATIDDVFKAYRWLIDREKASVALAGDSAGGGLVLTTIMKARDAGLPIPACGVCFSPWTDKTNSGDSVMTNALNDLMFYPRTADQFADAYIGDRDRTDPLISPLFGDFHGFPPMLFHVGSTEILVDDSRRVHEAILRAGGESTFKIYEGVFHSWQMGAGLIPEADASLREAAGFIREHSLAAGQLPPD